MPVRCYACFLGRGRFVSMHTHASGWAISLTPEADACAHANLLATEFSSRIKTTLSLSAPPWPISVSGLLSLAATGQVSQWTKCAA